jgi:hypothetical protein
MTSVNMFKTLLPPLSLGSESLMSRRPMRTPSKRDANEQFSLMQQALQESPGWQPKMIIRAVKVEPDEGDMEGNESEEEDDSDDSEAARVKNTKGRHLGCVVRLIFTGRRKP